MSEPIDEVVLLLGPPSDAKRHHAKQLEEQGYRSVTLGARGERNGDLPSRLRKALQEKARRILVNHTLPARRNRAWIIDLCRKNDLPARAVVVRIELEQAQRDACHNMIDRFGRLLEPSEFAVDDTLPSPARLAACFDDHEPPSTGEGFHRIDEVHASPRLVDAHGTKPGLLLDLDGTIRRSKGRAPFPEKADDVALMPNRKERLQAFVDAGVVLVGVSNQGGVGLGQVTQQNMHAALDRTVKLLGLPFDARACPHDPRAGCWCRKPRPGLAISLMREHDLDPRRSWMIGDRHPDVGLAKSLGIPYFDEKVFFSDDGPAPQALLDGSVDP
ncbi:MAG: HAD-IIIA family hydrolase [Myxococcota bacterium]